MDAEFDRFETTFIDWLAGNIDYLDAGGSGDLQDLYARFVRVTREPTAAPDAEEGS